MHGSKIYEVSDHGFAGGAQGGDISVTNSAVSFLTEMPPRTFVRGSRPYIVRYQERTPHNNLQVNICVARRYLESECPRHLLANGTAFAIISDRELGGAPHRFPVL